MTYAVFTQHSFSNTATASEYMRSASRDVAEAVAAKLMTEKFTERASGKRLKRYSVVYVEEIKE